MILSPSVKSARLLLVFGFLLRFLLLNFLFDVLMLLYGLVYDLAEALLAVIADQVVIQADELRVVLLAHVAMILLPD